VPNSTTQKVTAANRQGLTLAELRQFVAALDGAPDATLVSGTVRINGAVRELRADTGRTVITLTDDGKG
jgi:hypothetical protein